MKQRRAWPSISAAALVPFCVSLVLAGIGCGGGTVGASGEALSDEPSGAAAQETEHKKKKPPADAGVDKPDPSQVYVSDVRYAGKGCPAGSVVSTMTDDAQSLTLLFNQLIAQAGPTVPAADAQTACNVDLKLHVPQGWSFAILDVDFRGFVELDKGVTALQRADYHIREDVVGYSFEHVGFGQSSFYGDLSENYQRRDEQAFQNLVWSKCGAQTEASIDASLAVDTHATPSAAGLLTVDAVDGAIHQIAHIAWRRCK